MSVSGMTRVHVRRGSVSVTCQLGKRNKEENGDMQRSRRVGQWSLKGSIGLRKNIPRSTLLQAPISTLPIVKYFYSNDPCRFKFKSAIEKEIKDVWKRIPV